MGLFAFFALAAPAAAVRPVVDVVTPPDQPNLQYVLDESVPADYTCTDSDGDLDPTACVGSVADGAPLDTATLGPHTFTVTAEDAAHETTTVTRGYEVVPFHCDDVPDVEVSRNGTVTVMPDCNGTWDSLATGTPDHGDATVEGATIKYEAPGGHVGLAHLTYTATTAGGEQSTATVTVEVGPCADVSVTTYPFMITSVPLDCGQPFADPARTTVVIDPLPQNGDAAVADSGTAAGYRARVTFSGEDTFRFFVRDSSGDSVPATATMTVLPFPSGGGGGFDGGGGDGDGGGSGGSGNWLDGIIPYEDIRPPEGLPAIPYLPSLGITRNGNLPTAFTRDTAVRVSKRTLRASRSGAVRLRIANANPFQIEGRLVAEGAFARTKKHRRRAVPRLKMTAPAVSIRARGTITVPLSLSAAEQRLLARLGKARMRVTFRIRDLDRHVRTVRTTFTLRAPR